MAFKFNATKRHRVESDVSAASGLSTQTQLIDLSGSSLDNNSVFDLRRHSDNSDNNISAKNNSEIPEIPSNFKFDDRKREIMTATKRGSAQRVSFSIDDGDIDNEEMNGPCEGQCCNGGRIYKYQHTRPMSRPRRFSENNANTINYTGYNTPMHHSVSMPCECASCYERKHNIVRDLLPNNGAEPTYRKSHSVRSLPDIQNGIPLKYPVSNHRQMSETPLDCFVTLNETGGEKYIHKVFKNPSQYNPKSNNFREMETIYSGDTPSSTLENRQLPQRPGVDQFAQSYSDPSNEMVKSKSSQPLMESPVSSKHSSESSRSDKCFICNKIAVLVILNFVLILVIVSAVPVYLSVMVKGQTVSEQVPAAVPVQQQPHQMNTTCVSCSVLDKLDDLRKLGMEKLTDDLCCLKNDTNLVDFIIKMRVAPPTYVKAEDDEIYHGRPILQLESMGLDNRKITWNPRGLTRSGLALKDNHKIEFKATGYYFISTELAFKPNSKGILQIGFTAYDNKDKPLRSKSETLRNQPDDNRYVSECSFVDFFFSGSHLYVELDNVDGLLKEDGQILVFFLGN